MLINELLAAQITVIPTKAMHKDHQRQNESDKSPRVSVPRMFGGLYKTTEGVRWAHCELSIKLPKGIRIYCIGC